MSTPNVSVLPSLDDAMADVKQKEGVKISNDQALGGAQAQLDTATNAVNGAKSDCAKSDADYYQSLETLKAVINSVETNLPQPPVPAPVPPTETA